MRDHASILIVDDEIRIRETLSLVLSDYGYAVQTASRGDEAAALVGREKFDVVFLDQFLGPERGTDLMHRLVQVDGDLHFVLMTANGSTDLAVEAMKVGASDFITKPVFGADLVKSIKYVMTKRELARQRTEMLDMLRKTVEQKTEELNRINFSVLASLAQAMEKRDVGTFGHSMRVERYCQAIARGLGLGERERGELKAAAILHDIGKIGITDLILAKQGPLNAEERDIIKCHPRKGYEILKPLAQYEAILPAILHHHEKYDGSGYPDGIAGHDIPLLARIIAVADAYDAILSTRPYRNGASKEQAISELRTFSGSQFDPRVVQAFIAAGGAHRQDEDTVRPCVHSQGDRFDTLPQPIPLR